MELQILFLSLFVSIVLPLLVLSYLRKVLYSIMTSVCGQADAADFWYRCVLILAVTGSVVLVIGFVPTHAGASWLLVIRSTLILTAAGIFVAVAIVAKSIWSTVVKPAIKTVQSNNALPVSGGLK